MRTRSRPNLAPGTSAAVKLLVAGLTFTSVYVGVSAAYSAVHRPAEPVTLKAHTGARGASLAHRRAAASRARTKIEARQAGSDESGSVTVSSVTVRSTARAPGRCDRAFVARGVVRGGEGAAADGAVSYGWRLLRWSEASKRWRPYLSEQAGFAGSARAVEWHPHIVNNPGWYRVDLETASGTVYRSTRFHVSC